MRFKNEEDAVVYLLHHGIKIKHPNIAVPFLVFELNQNHGLGMLSAIDCITRPLYFYRIIRKYKGEN